MWGQHKCKLCKCLHIQIPFFLGSVCTRHTEIMSLLGRWCEMDVLMHHTDVYHVMWPIQWLMSVKDFAVRHIFLINILQPLASCRLLGLLLAESLDVFTSTFMLPCRQATRSHPIQLFSLHVAFYSWDVLRLHNSSEFTHTREILITLNRGRRKFLVSLFNLLQSECKTLRKLLKFGFDFNFDFNACDSCLNWKENSSPEPFDRQMFTIVKNKFAARALVPFHVVFPSLSSQTSREKFSESSFPNSVPYSVLHRRHRWRRITAFYV